MTERDARTVVVAAGSFAAGVLIGLWLNRSGDAAHRIAGWWRRDDEPTVEYDENLPEQLGRREPVPAPGQIRFGGTGALGVHPAAAETATPANRP